MRNLASDCADICAFLCHSASVDEYLKIFKVFIYHFFQVINGRCGVIVSVLSLRPLGQHSAISWL